MVIYADDSKTQRPANLESLPPLDASGVVGVREITKSELLILMAKNRPLLQSEKAQVDRGCPGLTCLYQGLGLTKWPELARGTCAYLRLEDVKYLGLLFSSSSSLKEPVQCDFVVGSFVVR